MHDLADKQQKPRPEQSIACRLLPQELEILVAHHERLAAELASHGDATGADRLLERASELRLACVLAGVAAP